MVPRKALVLSVTALTLIALGGVTLWDSLKKMDTAFLRTTGFPTLGDPRAKVELVIFEDLCCSACQLFDRQIFPEIATHYIDTGKVRYVVVPLAFLEDSEARSNAAWEVYRQNKSDFFPYFRELFNYCHEKMDRERLLDLARQWGDIDLQALDLCIENGCYSSVLQKHLLWAKKIMGNRFGTPTLYLNGHPVSTRSFEKIQQEIDQILGTP